MTCSNALIEQLRHACSVALGDLLAFGMPARTSTAKLLLEAIKAAESSHVIELALCEQERLFLRPNALYRFVVHPSCERCAEIAALYKADDTPEVTP